MPTADHPATQVYQEYITLMNGVLADLDMSDLAAITDTLVKAFHDGKTVYVAGNGGSAATASHMACDFQKTTLAKDHERIAKRFRAIALSDNAPLISAWGNDVHYDEVFAQQLRNLGSEGDALIVITASGNSPNILKALEAAKDLGVTTIGLLGFQGGKSKALCDLSVVAKSDNYGVIEDAHSIIMHMLTAHLRALVTG